MATFPRSAWRPPMRFVLIFAVLHSITSLWLFFVDFGRSLAHIDSPRNPTLGEQVVSWLSDLFLSPIVPLASSSKQISSLFRGPLGYVPFLANSVLWAFLTWWLIVLGRRLAARRLAREQEVQSLDVPAASDTCKRCGVKIEVDPTLSSAAFEGMHWLCFHLEFEHDGDPDRPCSDFCGCPWWTIRHYEERLRALGVSPEEVIQSAIDRHADEITS